MVRIRPLSRRRTALEEAIWHPPHLCELALVCRRRGSHAWTHAHRWSPWEARRPSARNRASWSRNQASRPHRPRNGRVIAAKRHGCRPGCSTRWRFQMTAGFGPPPFSDHSFATPSIRYQT